MTGGKRIARIPVCLNKEDPYQSELITHIRSYTNASAYLKSLVIRDYEDKKKKAPAPGITGSLALVDGRLVYRQ